MSKRQQQKLEQMAKVIRDAGNKVPETGGIEETLKWGQQSFLPLKKRVGTTVRIDTHGEDKVALYVHCQTNLVETYKTLFPELTYEGNRAVVFECKSALPKQAIKFMAEAALTYHLNKPKTKQVK